MLIHKRYLVASAALALLIITMIIIPSNIAASNEKDIFLPVIFTTDDQTIASSNIRFKLPSRTPDSSKSEWLPYGVPIPRGGTIDLPPKPYDPIKHGPLLENTQPEANIAQNPASKIKLPDRGESAKRLMQNSVYLNKKNSDNEVNASSIDSFRATQNTTNEDWGYWITATDYAGMLDPSGIYASNDAHTGLVLPATSQSIVLYAPTHMPPSNACLEASTAYFTDASNTSITHRGHGFWDHCNLNSWGVFELMNQQWQNKYLRIYNGTLRFWVEIMPLGYSCAIGILYNFDIGEWETKTSPAVCGESSYDNGWTMWEAIRLPSDCPHILDIRASHIHIYNADIPQWELLTPQTTSPLNYGTCFNTGGYIFETIHANYEWRANTW